MNTVSIMQIAHDLVEAFFSKTVEDGPSPRCRLGWHRWRRWASTAIEDKTRQTQHWKQYRYCHDCNICNERTVATGCR